jgi:predicted lactoylglutathione lyase
MIGYVTLGVRDLARAAEFYDALLAEFGAKRATQTDRFIFWGTKGGTALAVILPYDGAPASSGNGAMVALAVDTPEAVDRVYRKAIALGATDEGPAGARGGGFYGGYFRDLDGNKLNVFCMSRG